MTECERGLAVLVPGFLDSAAYPSTRRLADELAKAGITAAAAVLRGSWETSRVPAEYTTTYHLADVSTLVATNAPAGRRAILIGYCYGAWLAALCAAREPRVTDVVAIMPTRTFIWAEDYDPDRDTWRSAGLHRFVRDLPAASGTVSYSMPHTVVADALRYDAVEALRSLRQPVLFVAGEADSVITPDAVRRLYECCGSPTKELAVLPGVGHDYRYDSRQIDRVNRAVLRWLGLPLDQGQ